MSEVGLFDGIIFGLATIGAIVIVSILLMSIFAVCGAVLEWWRSKRVHEPSFDAGMEHFKNRLYGYSWWFSEDDRTMNLIQELARDGDVSGIRERWRDAGQRTEPKDEATK